MGTSITDSQIKLLNRYFDKVTYCFDGDRAGKAAMEKALIKTLAVMRDGLDVYFMLMPPGEDLIPYCERKGLIVGIS